MLGLFWFLSNLNVFDYSIGYLWTSIARLWPLIIVIVGAGMILQSKVAERILWIILLLVVVGYSIFLQVGNPFSDPVDNGAPNNNGDVPIADTYTYPMDEEIDSGILELKIGATRFELDAGSLTNVLEVDTTLDELYVDLEVENNQVAVVDIHNQGNAIGLGDASDNRLVLGLNDGIPWTIDMESGAIDADLDLSSIALQQMDLSLGAGKMSIRLGDKQEQTVLNVESGVSQLEIYIPQNTALTIRMDGALNSTNIDSLGLIKNDNTYTSPTTGTENGKSVELNLTVGLGEVLFHRY